MTGSPLLLPAHLRALVDVLCDAEDIAVFAVDEKRSVRFWNRGAQRHLGIDAETMRGQHCLRGVRSEECLRSCPLHGATGVTRDTLRVVGPAGDTQVYRRTLYPIWSEAEEPEFLGGVEVLRPASAVEALWETREGGGRVQSCSEAVRTVIASAMALAETPLHLHIEGELGTQRNVLARAIHERAGGGGRFLHLHGVEVEAGVLDAKDVGTLYIEEVPRLSADLQSLLAARIQARLEDGGVRPRILTSASRPVLTEVRAGRILTDLHRAMGPGRLRLPPLREREEDIEFLAERFVAEANARFKRQVTRLDPEVREALRDHPWPGNEMELRAVVFYAFQLGASEILALADLPEGVRRGTGRRVGEVADAEAEVEERERIRRALEETDGQVTRAAEVLGMSRSTLWRKRRRYNL